jgi:cytochrome c biogenesis protein CcdA/thiol-disulfide isomerase/thioredoxin
MTMTILLVHLAAFAGGVLTIFSPCILPVLPFAFSRAGRSFRLETLPMLAGLVGAFVLVAIAGTIGSAWVASATDAGRIAALVVLAFAGLSLLSERISAAIALPFVLLGNRLGRPPAAVGDSPRPQPSAAFLLGVATGLVWAPCAGPILGLLTAGAAAGADPRLAATLFLTFGAGAAAALALGIAFGGRALRSLRGVTGGRTLVWFRRGLGAAALATVMLLVSGQDARVFASRGIASSTSVESALLHRLTPGGRATLAAAIASQGVVMPVPTRDEGPLPEFTGATGWLNTPGNRPLTTDQLRGKVVVINVWTFACYNCLNALPHIKAIAAKYQGRDVVVVGVHTPELARERVPENVADAVKRLGVTYPVALDLNYSIWRAFNNEYWPSVYIADRNGRIRFHHFGEGAYDQEDRVVTQLLAEPGGKSAESPPPSTTDGTDPPSARLALGASY